MRFRADAGLSVLELVVVLGIVAGLLVVAAASLPKSFAPKVDAAAVAAFVSDARSQVILSGKTSVLTIAPRSMTFGAHQLSWDADLAVTAAGKGLPAEYRLVLYPDGSYSGAALSVQSPGGSRLISGVYRSSPSNG